jgi:hypothetical protein
MATSNVMKETSSAKPAAEDQDAKKRRDIAVKSSFQIYMLTVGMARLLQQTASEDAHIYLGMTARIGTLTEIIHAALQDDVPEEQASVVDLERLFGGMLA